MKRFRYAIVLSFTVSIAVGCGRGYDAAPTSRSSEGSGGQGSAGTGGPVDVDAFFGQYFALLDEYIGVMRSIKDEGSARAAAQKAHSLEARKREMEQKLEQLKRPKGQLSPEEQKRLEEELMSKLTHRFQQMAQESKRLQQMPEASYAYMKEMQRLGGTGPSVGRSPASRSGRRPRGPRSAEEVEQQMIERYGADRVARLEIYNLPGDVSAFIQKRVSAIAGSAAMSSRGSGKTMSITCAPVADIQDLAANIDFGTVTDVDLEQSVITVRADPSKLPAPLAPEITNPRDPDFYKQNLADLNCIDRGRIERAMERLAQVERKELRQEIADALKGHLLNKQPNIRRRAVKAYALWATEDIVPQMVDCLNDDEASVRQEALEALARLNDTRSYEPIAALLVTDNLQAGKYLKQIGSPAQKAVAEYFTHAEERVRHDALSLAKEIGTNEIVPELIEVLSQQDDRARHLAADILGKLRDERAVAPLCEMLLNDRVRGLAAGSLRKMGPMVEEVVLKGLKHPNPDVVKACCEILAEVGTEKSLPELSRLARSANFFVRASAMHAGRAVTSRRQPAPKGDIRAFGRSSPD